MTVQLYEVGGAVRDELLGLRVKDIDYTVVASSYDEMRQFLVDQGFGIYLEKPEYLTITAHFPKDASHFGGRAIPKGKGADFVLARKDGAYHDARHPDSVELGTLEDDLARRDFSVNAMAKSADGEIIDLFGGLEDLKWMRLSCVGSAEIRFTEDALRALRAIRFAITKGFTPDDDIISALDSAWLPPLLASLPIERVEGELKQCFKFDTLKTMAVLNSLSAALLRAIFRDGLWLAPTLKGR